MIRSKIAAISFSFLFILNSFATEIELIVAKTQGLETIDIFTIDVDSNNTILSFHKNIIDKNGDLKEKMDFDINDFADGFVVDSKGKKPTVILKSDNFTPMTGGSVVIKFLSNGLKTKYKFLETILLKSASGEWMLTTLDGEKIINLYFKKKKKVGVTIGVKEIIINKPI
jgi:hypothetical protein